MFKYFKIQHVQILFAKNVNLSLSLENINIVHNVNVNLNSINGVIDGQGALVLKSNCVINLKTNFLLTLNFSKINRNYKDFICYYNYSLTVED